MFRLLTAFILLRLLVCKDFLSIVEKSSGLYTPKVLEAKLKDAGMDTELRALVRSTVLATAANYAYIRHLHNLICFTQRLDLKILVFALDKKTHEHLNSQYSHQRGHTHHISVHSYHLDSAVTVEEAPASYRQPQFNLMSMLKIQGALLILRAGHNVVFIDPDVVLLRDPIPFMVHSNIDYAHSLNRRCNSSDPQWKFNVSGEGNTGLYFMKSNQASISLMEQVVDEGRKHPKIDDQSIFWSTISKHNVINSTIRALDRCQASDAVKRSDREYLTCPLDDCQINVGSLMPGRYEAVLQALKSDGRPLVSLHANYMTGIEFKEKAITQYGYWITNWPKNNSCSALAE